MNKKALLDRIIESLADKNINIPDSLEDKRKLYEELAINNDNYDLDKDILIDDDKYLRLELINRKLYDAEKIKTIDTTLGSLSNYSSVLSLWKGDITDVYCDAIVNSVDEKFSVPKEGTLDYAIRISSGVRLRSKIHDIMGSNELATSECLITRAFNLPCDFIIHVYVPKYSEYKKEESLENLRNAYLNIFECAKNNLTKILILPAIGCGESNYPKDEAAQIAVEVTKEYLGKYKDYFTRVIFDVYDDEMYSIYEKLLDKEEE